MNINVDIDRLILDGIGIEPGGAPQVQAAVEGELTRLLGEQRLPELSAGAVPRVTAGDIAFTHADHPVHIGHQIARAIFGSLKSHDERRGTGRPSR